MILDSVLGTAKIPEMAKVGKNEDNSRKDMKELLKTIVSEVNKMFGEQYNLISFDTLSTDNLMQLLCNIITHTGGFENWNYKKNPEEVMMSVFQSLRAIDYVPYDENNQPYEPELFRERLILGNRSLVHQVMYYILTHKEDARTYLYLSQFMVKVPVPPELEDQDFNYLKSDYDIARAEFWKNYKESQTIKEEAKHAEELREDIDRMNRDMGNLVQRIEQQREKVDSVSQKALYLEQAKQFRAETTQQKKLQDQYKNTADLVKRLDDIRATLEANVESRRTGRKSYASLVVSTEQEIAINRIIFSRELPSQLQDALKELRVCDIIASEYIPNKEELTIFENKVHNMEIEVKELIERKTLLTNTTEDKLGPFRNQAKVIANRRAEITQLVQSLKDALIEVDFSIEDKTKLMHEIVGGNILHGHDLKVYVNNLRSQSNVYKEYRSRLQAINNELAIVTRSLDILYLLDPNVEEVSRNNGKSVSEIAENVDDINELKLKCRHLRKELEQHQAAHTYARRDLSTLEKTIYDICELYNKRKEFYQEATGALTFELENVITDLKRVEKMVQDKEMQWRNLTHIVQENEKMLEKLKEEHSKKSLKSDTSPKLLDVLNERYTTLDKLLAKTNEEKLEIEQMREEDANQLEILAEISNLLRIKSEENSIHHFSKIDSLSDDLSMKKNKDIDF